MPRQARRDAPGTLYHVIVRGIEKRRIVDDRWDRDTTAPFTNTCLLAGRSLEPKALTCCANLPGDWALYAISVRRLIALHSGFLQTIPHGNALLRRHSEGACLRLVLSLPS
jgi:hypothetical protein